MADEEKTEDKPKKSGNMLMIILLVLVVLLLGAVGFIGYYVMTKEDAAPTGATQKAEQVQESSDSTQTFEAKIENLVLNITDAKGREKLMKLSFSIKSTEPTIEAIVEANNAEIVDAVIVKKINEAHEYSSDAVEKSQMASEMLEEINSIINEATIANDDIKKNNVKKLFFEDIAIQSTEELMKTTQRLTQLKKQLDTLLTSCQ